jgi:hypothetical protein
MPLPETLPKPTASKKVAERNSDALSSRGSTGFTSTSENTIVFFGRWPSIVSSSNRNAAVSPDNNYVTDDADDEYRDDHYLINDREAEPVDDGSFSSYVSNSILSTGTTTESISRSGSETSSNSSYSHIYEPRIIHQQRQKSRSSKGDVVKEKILVDIPEDEPIHPSKEVANLQPSNQKKPISSWKRLLERYQRENTKSTAGSATRKSSPGKMEIAEGLSSTSVKSKMEGRQTSRKEVVQSPTRLNVNPIENLVINEAVVAPPAGLGWFDILSWLSLDAPPDKVLFQTESADKPACEKGDHDDEQIISNAPGKLNENGLFGDTGAPRLEPRHPAQTLVTNSDEPRKDHETLRHRRKIPAILPMPLSFRKKKKKIQKQQEEQRLRILSILESEDRTLLLRDDLANGVSTLRQTPDNDSLGLKSSVSVEFPTDMIDSKKILPSSRSKSRLSKRQPTKSHRTEPMIVETEDGEDRSWKIAESRDNLVEPGKMVDEEGHTSHLDRNHFKRIEVHPKDEPVLHQGAFGTDMDSSTLPEPQFELDLGLLPKRSVACATHQSESLGKKKIPYSIFKAKRMRREMDMICNDEIRSSRTGTSHHKDLLGKKKNAYSILQEKKMLREMGKIVERRLRALEETDEVAETSNRIQPFCGCDILPTCT